MKEIQVVSRTKLTPASGAISRGSGKTRRVDSSTGSRYKLDQTTSSTDTTNDTPRMLVDAALVAIAADDASAFVRWMMNQRSCII